MRAYAGSELNIIRARPQGAKWYLAVHKPMPVAYYELTGSVSYPASNLSVSFLSGLSGSIRENQTVWVGTASGLYDLGMARITIPPATSNILNVSESGSGLINWNQSASTYLTVVNEMRPWSRHPKYDTAASQWRMDGYIAFSTAQQYAPYPNIDYSVIGVLDGASSWTASYIGLSSLFWDNAYLDMAWYFPDGWTENSNLGSETFPVWHEYTTASPGGSYIRMELVDTVGGSSMGHRLTFLFNNYSDIPRVGLAEITGGIVDGGYNTRLNVFNLNDTDIPPGTEIFIFEKPDYAGSTNSIGTNSIYGKNIVFRGWTTGEISNINPLTSSATIEAVTINGIMEQMSSYDIFMATSQTGASEWIESANLSLDRVAYQGLFWRSNVAQIANFTPASGLAIDANIQFQALEKGNLFGQMQSNYHDKGYLGYFASDYQSNLFAFADAQITGTSATISKLMDITYADRMNSVQVERDYRDMNSQVQLYAVTSVTPLAAESPGAVMGYFGTTQEISQGLLVDGQDTLITWTGNLRAKQNADFKRVLVPLSGNYKIDAIPQTRINMSLSAVDNARGYSWSNKGFWIDGIRTVCDAQSAYVHQELTLSEIVNGIGGSSITFPTVDDIIPAPIQLPSDQKTIPLPNQFGTGLKTVYVQDSVAVYRTRDFSADSPVYADITGSAVGDELHDWILDPWRPATRGYLLTDDGVYRYTDLDQVTPTVEHVLTSAQFLTATSSSSGFYAWKIIGSINQDNYFAFVATTEDSGGSFNNSTEIWCVYTSDGGDTWGYSLIHENTSGVLRHKGGFDYVPHIVSGGIRLYACFVNIIGGGNSTVRLYRSDNGGSSWSLVFSTSGQGSGSLTGGIFVHCPYNNNTDGNLVFWGTAPDSSVNTTWKSTNGGGNSALLDLMSADPGNVKNGGTDIKRTGLESWTQNNNLIYIWNGNDVNEILKSTDGGASFSEQSTSGMTGAAVYASGGFPTNSDQFYAVTNLGVFVSTDDGVTWINKTGDIPSISISVGIGAIVPLWTE